MLARGPPPGFRRSSASGKTLHSRSSSRGALVSAPAALPAFPPSPFTDISSALAQEVQAESALHISWQASVVCESEFGPVRPSPPIEAGLAWEHGVGHFDVGSGGGGGGTTASIASLQLSSSQQRSLAACLATPVEPAETPENEARPTTGGGDGGVQRGGATANASSLTASNPQAVQRSSASAPSLRDAYGAQLQAGLEYGARRSLESLDRWGSVLRGIRRRRRDDKLRELLSLLPMSSFASRG